jgi:eukaryotic-like serine/threonine-protein kinase
MGEVYRARDTKLNRDVAVKVLPGAFALDADRLSRFKREAQVLASLDHPNIGAIYGFEDSEGVQALVLQLVEGPTLADRIAQGPMPLEETLPIARQVAEALEAAHEKGVIHRDLKPANVKVTPDGTVKVLDFGLAKLLETEGGVASSQTRAYSPGLTQSPTITTPAMTQVGVILGTAAYMSPEQARGKPVDRRVDIWAFGVVLFEMLSGVRSFDGETISDVLAKVIEREPDWSSLPADTPRSVRVLLQQCLKKDPRTRLRDIGDARVQLEQLLSGTAEEHVSSTADIADSPAKGSKRRRKAMAIVAAAICGAAAASLGTWVITRSTARSLQTVRFTIVPSPALPNGYDQLVVSPDGKSIVYVSLAIPGGTQLMLRAIDQLDPVPLKGTLNARIPFFSADGNWIGFFADRELKKVSIAGGPAITVCRLTSPPRGATWGFDDTIIFATGDVSTGLLSVSAAGGEPTVLTTPDAANGEIDHLYPRVLPGGRAVLFTIVTKGATDARQIGLLDVKTAQRRIVLRAGSNAEYIDSGHLVYAEAGTLMAVAFDLSLLEVRSAPVPIAEHVMTVLGNPVFSTSLNGTIVHVPGAVGVAGAGSPRSIMWVDRQGREEPLKLPVRTYTYPRLSPDGTKLAIDIRDQENDIWVADLQRQTLTRLTFDPGNDFYPVWTPDGRRIVFNSVRAGGGEIFSQLADGTGQVDRLTTTPTGSGPHYPYSFAPDGKVLIYQDTTPKTGIDLSLLSFDGAAGPFGAGKSRTEPLVHSPAAETNAEISREWPMAGVSVEPIG